MCGLAGVLGEGFLMGSRGGLPPFDPSKNHVWYRKWYGNLLIKRRSLPCVLDWGTDYNRAWH